MQLRWSSTKKLLHEQEFFCLVETAGIAVHNTKSYCTIDARRRIVGGDGGNRTRVRKISFKNVLQAYPVLKFSFYL